MTEDETTGALESFLKTGVDTGKSLRKPTLRQMHAVKNLVGDGRSQADALRKANYSEAIVNQPQKVFGSPVILPILESLGFTQEFVADEHRRIVQSHKLDTMFFPIYKSKKDSESEAEWKEKWGEQLTDDEIKFMLADLGFIPKRIVTSPMGRQAFFYTPDNASRLRAIDMAYQLFGSYAPKKLDTKAQIQHTFSISALRKKAREHGRDVIEAKVTEKPGN